MEALNKQKAEIALSTKELEIIRSAVCPISTLFGSVEDAKVDITYRSGRHVGWVLPRRTVLLHEPPQDRGPEKLWQQIRNLPNI